MSEFDHILMYLNVVETKSFTKAADKLGISPNAVSKQVNQLEEELGLTLLSRSTRHLYLTEAGKIIYEKGKLARKSLEDIHEYARSSQSEPSGVLSVLSSSGVGQYLIAERLADFLHLYPKLDINLQFSDEFPNPNEFDDNSIDIIYGFPSSSIPKKNSYDDFIRRRVNQVQRIICASPQYLERYGEPKSYEDLIGHYVIIHSQTQNNPLLKECERRNIRLSKILLVNDSTSILRLLRNGVGVAMTTDFLVADELASGDLKRILMIHQEPKVKTYLFYKKARYLPLKISRFVEFYTV